MPEKLAPPMRGVISFRVILKPGIENQVFELVEFAGYLIGFWLFLFSKKFRGKIVRDFREGSFFARAVIIFEAVSSIFVSVILPAILVYYAFVE